MVIISRTSATAGRHHDDSDSHGPEHEVEALINDDEHQSRSATLLVPKIGIRNRPSILIILVMILSSMLYLAHNQFALYQALHDDSLSSSNPQQHWSALLETRLRPVDRSWCPDAKCTSSPMCRPCQRRFLIVITNGRSASTTLTWMLDLLPGLRMGGENNNALQNIMTMVETTTGPPYEMKPDSDTKYSAWYHNPVPDGALSCVSQKMIETIVPPAWINETHMDPDEGEEIIGFKTIRLLRDNNVKDVPKIAEFLKEHFPCARYLINFRSDFKKQADSQVSSLKSYQDQPANITDAVTRISQEVDRLKKMAAVLGKRRARIVDSAKWTNDVSELNEVVKWLGFDETCDFPRLMELNTGRSSSKSNTTTAETKAGNHRRLSASVTKGKSWGSWLSSMLRMTNKQGAKTSSAYTHGVTSVELDPHCRYVGN